MPRFSPRPTPFYLPAATSSPSPVAARDVWTDRGTDALVVGDVVLVTEQCEVAFRHEGRVAMRGTRKAPEKVDDHGRAVKRRCLRRTLAMVIQGKSVKIGKSEFTHRTLTLCVMWSHAEVAEEAYPVGRKVRLGQAKVGKDRLKRVERLVGSGPSERSDEAGRAMLLQRLLAACGPDPVERLRLAVNPLSVLAGTPETFSRVAAGMILDGSFPVRSWMISQMEGRMAIPEAMDKDEDRDREWAEMEAASRDEDDDYGQEDEEFDD